MMSLTYFALRIVLNCPRFNSGTMIFLKEEIKNNVLENEPHLALFVEDNDALLFYRKIAELAKEKRIEGITDLRDESNRKGIRVVIELRKDVNAEVTLNNLYKFTPLQTTFGINMLALVDNQPKVLQLREMLKYYVEHQVEVLTRKTIFELEKIYLFSNFL